MLTGLHLRNFKRFDNQGVDLQLAPLTLLIGANSAGKSSVFQAMLALKQSWEPRIDGFLDLRTQGHWAALGRFGNVIHGHVPGPVTIGLSWDGGGADFTWRAELPPHAPLPSVGHLSSLRLRSANRAAPLYLVPLAPRDDGKTRLGFDRESWLAEIPGESRAIFKIRRLLYEDARRTSCTLNLDPQEHTWGLDLEHVSLANDPADLGSVQPGFKPGKKELASFRALVGSELMATLFAARRKVDAVRYVGPARRAGQRLAPLDESGAVHCGPGGERIAEVLFRMADQRPAEARREAVNAMLRAMGTGHEIHVREVAGSSAAVELELVGVGARGSKGVTVGLPDVGFGVSQLLPILTEIAIMRENTGRPQTLLVEQPELHLNPRWQRALVGIVVAPLRLDRERWSAPHQVMLETHSSVIVDEISRLVHERIIDENAVCVLKTKVDAAGRTSFTRLPIDASLSRHILEDF